MKIVDLVRGWFGTVGDNELEIVSTMQDPPKLRFAVQEDKVESNLGGVSYNTIRPSGTHDEWALVQGRKTADQQEGAVYIAVRNRHEEPVREVAYFGANAIVFRAPISAPNIGFEDAIVSSDGRFMTVQQGDGNLVTYRRDPATGQLGVAVWASGFVE